MIILGLIAGALTTLSFLPQVIRTLRTRSSHDFSWGWLLLFVAGIAGWLLYGILTQDLPVTVANSITFALIWTLVALKAWQTAATKRVATQRIKDRS